MDINEDQQWLVLGFLFAFLPLPPDCSVRRSVSGSCTACTPVRPAVLQAGGGCAVREGLPSPFRAARVCVRKLRMPVGSPRAGTMSLVLITQNGIFHR